MDRRTRWAQLVLELPVYDALYAWARDQAVSSAS
jgi:hypothetical protein